MIVYFVSEQVPIVDDNGDLKGMEFIKIGFTSDSVHKRISQLQTGNSRTLYPVVTFTFESNEMARQVERIIHNRLKLHRANGEWFKFTGHINSVVNMFEHLCWNMESFAIPESLHLLEASNG